MHGRPLVHFSPAKNWMNDPNGCFFYDGIYHLYYQHNPFDIVWGPMHWGHARSSDLVTWRHEAIAMHPEGSKTIYSGSIILDTNNTSRLFPENQVQPRVVALYTRCHEDTGLQEQCLAYSLDGGYSFIQYPGNPVIPNPGISDFRDPKLRYHDASRSWIMVLAAHDSICLYRSSNLIKWDFISSTPAKLEGHDALVECPDLFELPLTRLPGTNAESAPRLWVLCCSFQSKELIPAQRYQIGQFDGRVFSPFSAEWQFLNYGVDAYAAQTWYHPTQENEKTQIAWSTHWSYANKTPMKNYRGLMSFPSLLRLSEDNGIYRVEQRIAPEINKYKQVFFSADCTQTRHIASQGAAQLIEIDTDSAEELSISCLWSDDCFVHITANNNYITFDRSAAGDFFDSEESTVFTIPRLHSATQNKNLKILVDYTIIELYISDAQLATFRVFPPFEHLQSIRVKLSAPQRCLVKVSALIPPSPETKISTASTG